MKFRILLSETKNSYGIGDVLTGFLRCWQNETKKKEDRNFRHQPDPLFFQGCFPRLIQGRKVPFPNLRMKMPSMKCLEAH